MDKPLISIIIPIYNVEKYLAECLDSVLAQSYDNLEIICVNDGSPDGSRRIAQEYSTKDTRIIILDKENGGLSDARNVGIDASTGDYLFFLDSDDVLSADAISMLLDCAELNDADIAASGYQDFTTEFEIAPHPQDAKFVIDTGLDLYARSYEDPSIKTALNTAWGKLYRKRLFSCIRYPLGVLHEDEFTTYKLFARSEKAIYLDLPLYGYRHRPNSIMSESYSMKRLSALDAMQERVEFFINFPAPHLIIPAIEEYLAVAVVAYRKAADKEVKHAAHERYRVAYRSYKKRMSASLRIRHLVFYLSPVIYKLLLQAFLKVKGAT